ncbi:MAG: response regulator [Candidatus Hydrogenedentes bacterium]|nr:response regulator [Candidatus Hydrogenedentota bacterium]
MAENSTEGKDRLVAENAERIRTMAMIGRGVAHDINNLMENIIGTASLLRNDLAGSQAHVAMLDSIERAAELAGRLTQRMMALTQQNDNRIEPVNINAIVYHLLLVEETHLARRIRIVRHIDPDLWRVQANHTQVAQILVNLATNAVESIPGNGRVTIRTNNVNMDADSIPAESPLVPGPYVLVTIEDDGEGMSENVLKLIFEPGFTTRPGKTGQGLATAAAMARAMGGMLSASSHQGEGSVFRVYLPAIPDVAKLDERQATTLPHGTETVLVVDDERMIADVMQETLKRLGYRTLVARDGREAVDVARSYKAPIDLALLDIAMPVMGGADAFPLLKEIHPNMKVIVCTGFEQELISGELLRSGVDAFLLKPFRLASLAQEVRKVLDTTAS